MRKIAVLAILILLSLAGPGWGRDYSLGLGLAGGDPWYFYTIVDTFPDAHAAGAVNGTNAFKSGTRNVTDTTSVLSTSGGKLVSGTGPDSSYGAPRLINSTGIVRAPGKLLGGVFSKLTDFDGPGLTFTNSATAYGNRHTFLCYSSNRLFVVDNVVVGVQVGRTTLGCDYALSIIEAAAGAFYFVDGADYLNPTLLYKSPTTTTTPLYAMIGGKKSQFNAGPLYEISTGYLPAPLVYDQFNRANEILGATVTPGYAGDSGLGAGGSGLTWVNRVGQVNIVTNKAMATSLTGGRAVATVPLTTANVYAIANLTKGTTGCGIVVRYTDTDNYVYLWHDGTSARLVKRVGGVETAVKTVATTYAAGGLTELIADGASFDPFYNSVSASLGNAQNGLIFNRELAAGLSVGLIFFDTDSSIDNFCTYARGNLETTYSNLSKYARGKRAPDPLLYQKSAILSGFAVTYDGTADNYSVAAGTAILNGKPFSFAGGSGHKAVSTMTVANSTMKDPFIYKEGSTYYCFTDIWANGANASTSGIGYFTAAHSTGPWTYQGILIAYNQADVVSAGLQGLWEPALMKIGSTYYLYLCGMQSGTGRCAYLTSSSLTGPYVWGDYVKDANGTALTGIDGTAFLDNGTYYFVYCKSPATLTLHSCANPATNRWTLVGDLIVGDGVTEAPRIVPYGGKYNLLFGYGDSATSQRVALATAPAVTGPYFRQGTAASGGAYMPGTLYLDSPESDAVDGPINTPAPFWDDTTQNWYCYVGTGAKTTGNNSQNLTGYVMAGDFSKWVPLATSTQLFASATNYLYINPAGQLMHAAIKPPFCEPATFITDKGWLYLGSLTVDADRKVTAFSSN